MTDELLPPPPPGMDARVDHEGVTWAIGVHHGQLTGGVLAIAVGLVGVAAGLAVGTAFGPWIAALGLVIAAIGATVATQATRTTEVQLRARTVTVTKRSGWPRAVTRQAVRIDDLTAVRVGSAVAVETRDDAVVFGAHTPRAHLDWF
ncbi:MAG: hypothetical protein ABMB14_35975, partial [Myxococcota bacterium]